MKATHLEKKIAGRNVLPNILLVFQILFDLFPQFLLMALLSGLISRQTDLKKMEMLFLLMFGSFLLKAVCSFLAIKISHQKAYKTLSRLRIEMIEHLKKVNLSFYKKHTSGELTNIIEHDVEQVEFYLAHGLPEIMATIFFPLLTFLIMIFIDYRLALVMLLGVPLMIAVQLAAKKTMEKNIQIYFSHETHMREELMDYVKNIAVAKAFSREETISARTLKTAKDYIYGVKKSMGGVTVPMALTDVFMELGTVSVMILGSVFLSQNQITIFQFILSIVLASIFTASIGKVATLQHFMFVFKEAAKNIGKILKEPIVEGGRQTPPLMGEIQMNHLSFAYEKEGFQLKNINLTFQEKSLNAIVGLSGCGKTTLTQLLKGFWPVEKGMILIGGEDLSSFSQDAISDLIGTVDQDTFLFNASIYENIALGKAGATKEEIIDAAKRACCHDFIVALPQGYEAQVGEAGYKLSGGEKQRIAIARMILKNAPILILDEALASVDNENERLIAKAINELSKDKTVITISHHLNRITNSDQIVVMEKGEVLDRGTHEELMKRCSFYQQLVHAQNSVNSWKILEEV